MAKGSAQGLWKGKKGNSVFYKIKNSNNAQKQGIRERVYDVSNPKSTAQVAQRMKMLPAQRLAGAIYEIIKRGFEGVKYGAKSLQEFMKYALAMKSGFPATHKNEINVLPGRYLISKGSLPTIDVMIDSNYSGVTVKSLKGVDLGDTFGDIAADLLNNNAFLKAGDQLTFVFALSSWSNTGTAPIVWLVESFYLDVNDNTPIAGTFLNYMVLGGDEHIAFNAEDFGDYDYFCAATVVLSREGASGQHLRSSQVLTVANYFDYAFTPAAYAEAARSYQDSAVVNSDWPTDPSDESTVVPGGGIESALIEGATVGGVADIAKWKANTKPCRAADSLDSNDKIALIQISGDNLIVSEKKTLSAWGLTALSDTQLLNTDNKAALIAEGWNVASAIYFEPVV